MNQADVLANKINTADVQTSLQTKIINSADMLPIKVKGAHLLAIKTNLDVKMTDNGKSKQKYLW